MFLYIIILLGLASPTFWLAKLLKTYFRKQVVIRILNWVYFVASILSMGLLIYLHLLGEVIDGITKSTFAVFWATFSLSRCAEIFYAFLIDAYDKVASEEKTLEEYKFKKWHVIEISTPIKMHHRLIFASRSYVELIINFSIIYYLTPLGFWKKGSAPIDILNDLYFSGVTITTLGYGDISPSHWFTQFLSIFEVFCGFALIVVCFAVYLSRKSN